MAGHRCRSRCPGVGDTLSRSRRAPAPAQRSDAVADRALPRHAPFDNLADATRSLADRASARCTLRLVGVSPQVNQRADEASVHAVRSAVARDANRRRQRIEPRARDSYCRSLCNGKLKFLGAHGCGSGCASGRPAGPCDLERAAASSSSVLYPSTLPGRSAGDRLLDHNLVEPGLQRGDAAAGPPRASARPG
jgi:hypothetical protein